MDVSVWTVKDAEPWRIDAFELWCWRRFLRAPWTARGSNQSTLMEINPEYSLEGLMLKLKLQYLATWCEELTHWKRPWCWERLNAGEEGKRGREGWIPTQCTMNLRKLWEIVKDRGAWHAEVHEVTNSQTQFSDWTTSTTTQGLEARCPCQVGVRTKTLLRWELRSQDPWRNGRSSLYPSGFFWLVWELTWCETD